MKKQKILILIVILFFLGFVWFELRPAIIRSECAKKSSGGESVRYEKVVDYNYKYCLRVYGLK